MNYYLAIDIGASSGRHILGSLQNGRLVLEEIYRFPNTMVSSGDALTWDLSALTEHVLRGLERCREIGKIPTTVAIDTWGVDYVLLDESNKEILPAFAYRDARCDGVPEIIDGIVSRQKLFERTGIHALTFNSIYQLYCDKQAGRLKRAAHFLMMPDYLSYRLTGRMANEYTNATTSGLVNAGTKTWDEELLSALGFPKHLFRPLSMPGTELGAFSEEVAKRLGFQATVIHAPSHDTAAAVAACPLDDSTVYISSGTWSLIGTENAQPVLDYEATRQGFSNEGGVDYRYRFLENIMGMWLFQNIRKNLENRYTYDEMMNLAMGSRFEPLLDPNDPAFLAPENMLYALREALGHPELPLADVLHSVYRSLATSYKRAIETIEAFSAKHIDKILIVGGGSKDAYLNRLTAEITGRRVITGLSEATATGNLLSQIMYSQAISLPAAREIIKKSFKLKEIDA